MIRRKHLYSKYEAVQEFANCRKSCQPMSTTSSGYLNMGMLIVNDASSLAFCQMDALPGDVQSHSTYRQLARHSFVFTSSCITILFNIIVINYMAASGQMTQYWQSLASLLICT
jgi:hypothetical protein